MKVVVSTHHGVVYNEDANYVVVKNENGEFAVMNNHIPIVSVITDGYIKLVSNGEFFLVITNGIFEFKKNTVNVLAQEAIIGNTLEEAKKSLESIRKEKIDNNKKKHIDYTEQEKELKKNIKASKAGNL